MKRLYLYINHHELVGTIYCDIVSNKEVFSFEYDSNFLRSKRAFEFDPSIFPYEGRQYSSDNEFGFIQDLIPDRFGKMLLDDRENKQAKKENRLPKKLSTYDYLVAVNDLSRLGAFRLKEDIDGEFVNSDKELAIPPYIYLRDIEEASHSFEENGEFDKEVYQKLLLPGSSLGGARPKANVYYDDELWIAKFPSINDKYDVEAWELTMLDLARECGINVSDFKYEKYSDRGATLLTKRFDRDKNKRIHYASFMTFLDAKDGESGDYSYLDLVAIIKGKCNDTDSLLNELYRRIIFTYLINNTDNHLRNHGLLLKDDRFWTLAPMFDVNPTFYISSFGLSLIDNDTIYSKDTIVSIAKYFNISKEKAIGIYSDIYSIIVNKIGSVSRQYGVKEKELNQLKMIIDSRK